MIRKRRVDHLLMGGQACVLYGAAEFSRDLDLALLPDQANLDRLGSALDDLEAGVIAIPPFEPEHLAAGLAVHFRCRHPEVEGLRIDFMTRMRGVDEFPRLWERRTTFSFGAEVIDVFSLPDLVVAKKTQCDKDWPMIRRLVDGNYLLYREQPSPERIVFWLCELRTPELLLEAVQEHPEEARRLEPKRPLLALISPKNLGTGVLERALRDEEDSERRADRVYWQPLRAKLAELRRAARQLPQRPA